MTNNYRTIRLSEQRGAVVLQLYRPEADNAINSILASEMTDVLIRLEDNTDVKVIVLEGLPDYFCTGMDFRAISDGSEDSLMGGDPNSYFMLLKQFSCCPQVVVAKVEGKVNAGGIGIVAASDIVVAGEKATFGLSEALFGLLPACVMPFLIRRIGSQKAQWMSLITQPIPARRAYEIGLADELSAQPNDAIRRNLLRLTKLETETIRGLKEYMSQLYIINEQTRELAVNKITSLVGSEKVQMNIRNFIQNGKFPWDK